MPETLNQLLNQDGPVTKDQLTPEVIAKLREEIAQEPTSEREENLRKLDELISKANEEAKQSLTSLKEELETPIEAEYSLEGIRTLNDSEVFELFFERPEVVAMYRLWIQEKISAYPYMSEYKDTIEITVWNHLVSQFSFSGISGYIGSKMGDFISGKVASAKDAFAADESLGETKPVGIDSFTSILDSLEKVSGAFGSGEGESESVNGFIDNIQAFIEDISKDYFQNLEGLHTLLISEGYIDENGNVMNNDIHSILSNPYALSALGKEGKYEGEGSSIILGENANLNISPLSDEKIGGIQDQFLHEVGTLTGKKGKTIDGFRNQGQKVAKLLSRLGFDSESLSGFKEFLEGLPGVGPFLASLLGFFIGDSVISELDKIGMSAPQRKALENLGNYLQDTENTDSLPFTPRDENPGINGKENRILKNFINKIESSIPTQGDDASTQVATILEDPKLAEKLFTGKGIDEGNTNLAQIHAAIASLSSSGVKLSQEEFFEQLSELNIEPEEDAAQDVALEDAVETEATIAEFSEATGFPFLYNGTEINYNSETFELQVGDKKFKIGNISGNEVSAEDIVSASPNISFKNNNVVVTFKIGGIIPISQEIDKNGVSDLLDQAISGNSATLNIPTEANTITIEFIEIK